MSLPPVGAREGSGTPPLVTLPVVPPVTPPPVLVPVGPRTEPVVPFAAPGAGDPSWLEEGTGPPVVPLPGALTTLPVRPLAARISCVERWEPHPAAAQPTRTARTPRRPRAVRICLPGTEGLADLVREPRGTAPAE